jgi:hypothetical protein
MPQIRPINHDIGRFSVVIPKTSRTNDNISPRSQTMLVYGHNRILSSSTMITVSPVGISCRLGRRPRETGPRSS